MKKLIEFPTEDGDWILVEVEVGESGRGALIPASQSSGEDLPIKASITIDHAMEKVKPAAASIIKKLRTLADPPDQIVVGFGLKLSATAGAIVASTAVEANYSVTLTWKRQETK